MHITTLHQCVLDALGLIYLNLFGNGRGPDLSYEVADAIMMHSQLAADVTNTLVSLQKAMSSIKLRPW